MRCVNLMACTQIKVCGITRIKDGQNAVALGADAIGLVFYPPSPRAIQVDIAAEIAAAMPPFTKIVGVFVNASQASIRNTLGAVRLDLLQFHGNETPDECEQYQIPYIKALAMRPGVDAVVESKRFSSARGLLLDAWHQNLHGGSGTSFDWSLIPDAIELPVILAGGLDATNVAQAVRQVRPFGVDVSGGGEASKGIKDKAKLGKFMEQVHSV